MSEPEKSLAQPPENLKEAIDWVLRVSGYETPVINTAYIAMTLHAFLRETQHVSNDFLGKALKSIKTDETVNSNGPIAVVTKALQKFIGYENDSIQENKWRIGKTGVVNTGERKSYMSVYGSSPMFSDIISQDYGTKRKKVVQCFFTAIQIIFEELTELYYNCKNGWAGQRLSGNSGGTDLNQFMVQNGFSNTRLNSQMTGSKIADTALHGLSEFSTAYIAASENPPLDAFRYQLEQNAMSKPSEYPLSALYILATYVYVQSTSPATPSFLGYSGLGALAGGTYGLNLGGLGTLMSALLA